MVYYLECIELDIGIAVRQALDQALDCLVGAIRVTRHFVADLDDSPPVLRREVLVGRLG